MPPTPMTRPASPGQEDDMTCSENGQAEWDRIYKIGGIVALGAVLVGLLEMLITFLPGGKVSLETVRDWFVCLRPLSESVKLS